MAKRPARFAVREGLSILIRLETGALIRVAIEANARGGEFAGRSSGLRIAIQTPRHATIEADAAPIADWDSPEDRADEAARWLDGVLAGGEGPGSVQDGPGVQAGTISCATAGDGPTGRVGDPGRGYARRTVEAVRRRAAAEMTGNRQEDRDHV
jgi:hypothetical protein